MSNKSLPRRALKKMVTLRTLLPIFSDRLAAHASRRFANLTSTPYRKIAWAAPLFLASAILAQQRLILLSLVCLTLPLTIFGAVIRQRINVWLRVRALLRKEFKIPASPLLKGELLRLQIDPATVVEIQSEAELRGEVVIAEFDQQNRILSHVGPIPGLEASMVTHGQFQARARHRVTLVVISNTLAIKKVYRTYNSFSAELLALSALASTSATPSIVSVDRGARTIYLTFIFGRNLGSLMVAQGVSITDQQRFSQHYPGATRWSDRVEASPERTRILDVFAGLVDPAQQTVLVNLLREAHLAGCTIRDVKYGNIILQDGDLRMYDFDGARVFASNTREFTREREIDRDKFNYFFGTRLQTRTVLLQDVRELLGEPIGDIYSPIYYGNGYGVGQIASIEKGSGKWLFIHKCLPQLQDKYILDLGSNNALLPLEMLRAGARRVTAYELKDTHIEFAKINHEWFEFVDNTCYDLDLVQGRIRDVCNRSLSDFDIATAFCSLYYEEPKDMEEIVRVLSLNVGTLVVQCNENPDEHEGELRERSSLNFLSELLKRNGFPRQKVFEFAGYTRPLIVAERERKLHD